MANPKDGKGLKEYNISAYNKGFLATSNLNGVVTNDYFHFKEIYNVIHHPNVGVEIVGYRGNRRIFYHDLEGDTVTLYTLIKAQLLAWVQSNKN